MPNTPSPQRTPILIKTTATLVVLALTTSILVSSITLPIAFAIAAVYLAIGLTFSILPTLSRNTPTR